MKEYSDKNQNENTTNSNPEKNLPFYMRLYPPLESITQTQPDFRNLLKLKLSSKKSRDISGNEVEEDELTQDFLDELIKPSSNLSKTRIIEVISKYILKSKLIEKIEDENKYSKKKIDPQELSALCAKKFIYTLSNRGEIVFKIGDVGDKFYFILKGKANILKIKEIQNIYMSTMEYLNYCIFLIKSNENYLFQEVIQKNYNILQITSAEEVLSLYKIAFKKSVYDKVNQHIIYSNNLLEEYFKAFNQKYTNFDLDNNKLEVLEANKAKKLSGSYREWQNYILKKFELSTSELVSYEPYEQIIKDRKKKKIICFVYESFLFLGPGLFFGDSALDSDMNLRNATIRAEEDTYFGCLRSNDYLNMIAPKRRYEKMKEISFLYNNFFFQNINPHIFERNYFHRFYLKQYSRGTVLYEFGQIPKNILLIKEGQIRFDLKCSIIEIHKLIHFLYNKILKNDIFSKLPTSKKKLILSPEITSKIHKYLKEPKLERLKMQTDEFVKEMNKIRIFHMSLLIGVEAVGLEEIFMNIPYLMKATVMKNVKCYEFSVEQIYNLLKEGKKIRFTFALNSIKKILSLMERLQGIKKNCVEMNNARYNLKNEKIFENSFSSIEHFPKINNAQKNDNIENKSNENNLKINNDSNYIDNIYDILEIKTPKSNKKEQDQEQEGEKEQKQEKEQDETNEEYKIKNEIFSPKIENDEKYKKNMDIQNLNPYKKIQVLNNKNLTRNCFSIFKSPIKDFTITQNLNFKTILFPLNKNNKLKNLKMLSYNRKKKNKYKSYNEKSISINDSDEKTGSKTKSKLDTGINVKNVFLLGNNKYYTINKLKKQIKDFNSFGNSKRTIEIIQSNNINMNNDNKSLYIKGNESQKMNNMNFKYSQKFNNFHLSFVPISVGSDNISSNNNRTIDDNNFISYKNIFRNNNYSTFGDKLYQNKSNKNYFNMTKKNVLYKKNYLNRNNSDFTQLQEKLPEIQSEYINFRKKLK